MSRKNQENKDKRPLSPHISIYKWQITSVLSIAHRLSGIAIYIGAILLAWWIIANIYGCALWVNSFITSPIGKLFLVLWSIGLFYHMLNGIRHLFWDMGKGFEIPTVNRTGIFVIIGTILLTALSWWY